MEGYTQAQEAPAYIPGQRLPQTRMFSLERILTAAYDTGDDALITQAENAVGQHLQQHPELA